MKAVDISGQRFGRLIALERSAPLKFTNATHTTWKCRCSCGTEITVETQKLRSGHTQSCGCAHKIVRRPGDRFGRLTLVRKVAGSRWLCRCDCGNITTVTGSNLGKSTNSCGCGHHYAQQRRRTHGHNWRNSAVYRAWRNAKTRCYNPKCSHWARYGGRGIAMCARWRDSFEAFAADMGPRLPGYTLERKNNDGNYEPGNCLWAPHAAQARNKGNTLTFDGHTLKDIATQRGLSYYTVRAAFIRGRNPMTFLPRRYSAPGMSISGRRTRRATR